MKELNFLIKPASSKCNLNCKYCFYHDTAENRDIKDYGIMTKEVLETLIKKSFEYKSSKVHFSFQGGEPTIAKLDYFYNMHELVKKYNTKNIEVNFSMQTNGILINDEWAEMFKKYNYLIGISLDGPEDLHNLNRQKNCAGGTFNDVINAINCFRKYDINFNILTVVTKDTTLNIDNMMSFFEKENFKYLQFIPCIDPMKANSNKDDLERYKLNGNQYLTFLRTTFMYYKNYFLNNNYTSIRYFDNLVSMFLGKYPESCGMIGYCSLHMVVEADGSVYLCDFYVLDEYKLGNINTHELSEILSNPIGELFMKDSLNVPTKCKVCKYANICRGGGCKRYKVFSENKQYYVNKFCKAYYQFFDKHYDDFLEISKKVKKDYFK